MFFLEKSCLSCPFYYFTSACATSPFKLFSHIVKKLLQNFTESSGIISDVFCFRIMPCVTSEINS